MVSIENDEVKNYTVYKHTSPSGKVYIGITCCPVEKRWGKNGSKYKTQPFYRAIKKYGWDNINHEILFTNLSKDEAFQKEIELIKYYNSTDRRYGYNISNGGNEVCANHSSLYVPVNMYDKKGNLLTTFESIQKAKDITGVKNINACLSGKEKTAGGYVWRYTTDAFDKYPCDNLHLHAVVQYDINGNYIAEFESIAQAEKQTNGKSISECVVGRKKTSGGFVWRYKGDPFDKYEINTKYNTVPVKQYSLDGVYIKTYPSQRIASQEAGINVSHISSVCTGRYISCGGYVWRYENDDFDTYRVNQLRRTAGKVYQYSLNGILIKIYDCANDAIKEYGGGVSHCLNGRSQTAYGYVWKKDGESFSKPVYQNSYSILQYDLNNNFICKYDSINDIPIPVDKKKKVCLQKVKEVINNKRKTAYGYIWRHRDEVDSL